MTAPSSVRGGHGPTLSVLGNEVAKGLLFTWRRFGLLATSVIEVGFTYVALRFLIGGGRITDATVAVTFPALLAQFTASTSALQGSAGIAEEVNSGTMEQALLSPSRPVLPVFGRLGALTVEALGGAAVLGIAVGLIFGVHYPLRLEALIPAALIVLDALAYAAMITALTLAVVSIGAVTHVFNMSIMFFNGMLVPIAVFPVGIQLVAKIVPTTLGVQALNSVLAGHPLGASWADGTLPWLLVHIAASAGVGGLAFRYTIRRARREGGLSPR